MIDAALEAGVTSSTRPTSTATAAAARRSSAARWRPPRPGRPGHEVRPRHRRRRDGARRPPVHPQGGRGVAPPPADGRIDLYQYHRPDGVTPLEETLEALHELVQAGKVRAIGSSNFTPAMVEEAAATARAWADPVRLRAEPVLVAPARCRGRPAARLRAPRRRLHPLLPARQRTAHGQVRGLRRRPRAPGYSSGPSNSPTSDFDVVEKRSRSTRCR